MSVAAPEPLLLEVRITQEALLTAAQVQPEPGEMTTEPEPPEEPKDCATGERE